MKRRYEIASLTVLLALGGCAQSVWVKPGATQAQFQQDKQQCIYEAELHGQNANPFNILYLVPDCLRAKGYTQMRKPDR